MNKKGLTKGFLYGLSFAVLVILIVYGINLLPDSNFRSYSMLFSFYLCAPSGVVAEKIVGSNSHVLYKVLFPILYFIYFSVLGVLSIELWNKNKKWYILLFILVLIIIHVSAYHFWDWLVIDRISL